MISDPNDLTAKFAVAALTEVFKEAVKGVAKLSRYLSNEAETKDLLGRAVRAYTVHLADKFNEVKVVGMQSPIPLEQIYTKVRVLDRLQKTQTWTGGRPNGSPYGAIRQGIDVINDTQRVAILGRPGAGKTTFLRHVLLQALEGRLRKPVIPIFIVLNDISAEVTSVFEAMVGQFLVCEITETEVFLRHLLKRGRCIILLDGLDEVSTAVRPRVIREIVTLSDRYPLCQFVVSCRVAKAPPVGSGAPQW